MYVELAQHYAVKVGHTHVAKLLTLDGSFDFRELNDHGDTALHIAARHVYKELMSCLLSLPYIDLNTGNRDRVTALHLAIWHGSEIIPLLLADPRIDVKPIDSNGQQPLHWATDEGELEALKTLIADPRIDPWAKSLESDPSWKAKDVMELALERRQMRVIEY
jgi:ankyrin repeat protein